MMCHVSSSAVLVFYLLNICLIWPFACITYCITINHASFISNDQIEVHSNVYISKIYCIKGDYISNI